MEFKKGEYVELRKHLIEEATDYVFVVISSDTQTTLVIKLETLHYEQKKDSDSVHTHSFPTNILTKSYIFDINSTNVAWNNQTSAQTFGKCYSGIVPPLHKNKDGTTESSLKFLIYRPSTEEYYISVRLAWGHWVSFWAHATNFVGLTI
jgi:hypothetical protein